MTVCSSYVPIGVVGTKEEQDSVPVFLSPPLSAQRAARSPMEDTMSIGRFVSEFFALLSMLVMIYLWGMLGYALHA